VKASKDEPTIGCGESGGYLPAVLDGHNRHTRHRLALFGSYLPGKLATRL
jgi:hypothetical protein